MNILLFRIMNCLWKNICLQLKKYIMLLNRDELYEKLETAILNLPKRTFF